MAKAQRREKLFYGTQRDIRYSPGLPGDITLHLSAPVREPETYQCYPSYKTIGKAIGMSENTVAKYVRQLEEKGLIYTEPTVIRSKDGRPLNGNLLYTIRSVHGAFEAFYERQFRQVEEDTARYRAAQLLEKPRTAGLFKDVLQRNGEIYGQGKQRTAGFENAAGNQKKDRAVVRHRQLPKHE